MRWAKTDHIAIALSGGVDSSVLYHMLSTSYKDTYQSLTIFHVNHG
ncbi:ATP-binding protein, partial [Haloferula chungangensis]